MANEDTYTLDIGALTVTKEGAGGKTAFVHRGMSYHGLAYAQMVAIERVMADAMDALVKMGESAAGSKK